MDAHSSTAPSLGASNRPAERPTLGREAIVTAALRIIDDQGVDALSMRALGKELGYEAMALYRHVAGREDLLEAVVDSLMSDLALPEPDGSWQDYLAELAHRVRAVAHEHPRAFRLLATRHPAAPWLRPPLRSLDIVEHVLSSLLRLGWERQAAVAAYQAFSSFLLGHLLLETAGATAPIDASAPGEPNASADLADYPTITAMEPLLRVDGSDEEFAAGLQSLVSRLAELRDSGPPR